MIPLLALDAAESALLDTLTASDPSLADAVRQQLPTARAGIMERLVLAVYREELVREAHLGADLTIALAEGQLSVPIRHRHAFNRLEFAGPVTLHSAGVRRDLTHPRELLALIRPGGLDDEARSRWDRFDQELGNSVANYALSLAGAARREAHLRRRAPGSSDALDWVTTQQAADPRFSPLAFFEQWVIDGHPLHPGAKIKMGMSPEEVMRYSPEWEASPELALVAVRRHACHVHALDAVRPLHLLMREYPELELGSALAAKGLSPDDVELIPVHPWQHEKTLPVMHAAAIAAGDVIPLDGLGIPAQALMSFRSFAPIQPWGAGRHHLKTAVNVQTTGAVRTVSPQSAQNGPEFSRLLRLISAREQAFHGHFRVLEERLGIAYAPPTSGEDASLLSRNLAALFRENPEDHVGPGEIAMPGSALLARSPFTGKPVALELVSRFARNHGLPDLASASTAFMRRYAATCLPAFLTLMTRYGLSLEGHLQNSVAVFRDGMPVRMLVRDFGGVRILGDRLKAHGLEAQFHRGSATVIDDVADLRNKLFYPVFQNHLGELIATLVRDGGADPHALWGAVAEVCRETYRVLKQDTAISPQAAEDEAALFAPGIDLKAMVTMRLKGDVTQYTFAQVPNPLAFVGVRPALGREEAEVLSFLEEGHPAIAPAYLAALPRARRFLLRRLTGALLRERMLDGKPDGDGLRVDLGPDAWLHVGRTTEHAFNRLSIDGAVSLTMGDRTTELEDSAELLRGLQRVPPYRDADLDWDRLEAELRNGNANLAMAYAYWEAKRSRLAEDARRLGVSTSLTLALALRRREPDFDAALFFERLCVEGHPLHPGTKTKMDMAPADVFRYAPEFDGMADVRMVAIRRAHALASHPAGFADSNALLLTHHPQLAAPVAQALAQAGLTLDEVLLAPVHPWQWEQTLFTLYSEEIAQGLVIPLPEIRMAYAATASFRTLVPRGNAKGLVVKLAVDSQMTSTVRSISPATALNAPRFSALIEEVLAREPELHGTLLPVSELGGVSFASDDPDPARRARKQRNLTVVWRERLAPVSENALPIVGSALYAESPVTGKPILIELLDAFARKTGSPSLQEAAGPFLSCYASLLLPGVLTLLTRYGIALEGHMQNCIPVFEDGMPVRMLFRDWGGVRIHRSRLEAAGLKADFEAHSITVTDDLTEARNKAYYTVLQSHLAEIVLQLARHTGVSERDLWPIVASLACESFARLKADPRLAAAAQEDEAALFAETVETKALTRMRLSEDDGYHYAAVPNPLVAEGGGC
ncbi:Aerobactin synthase [compost metagenome]